MDDGLSPSVATRLCKKYNDMWACKSSEMYLKCIKGYCVSDKYDLTLAQVKRLVKKQLEI